MNLLIFANRLKFQKYVFYHFEVMFDDRLIYGRILFIRHPEFQMADGFRTLDAAVIDRFRRNLMCAYMSRR